MNLLFILRRVVFIIKVLSSSFLAISWLHYIAVIMIHLTHLSNIRVDHTLLLTRYVPVSDYIICSLIAAPWTDLRSNFFLWGPSNCCYFWLRIKHLLYLLSFVLIWFKHFLWDCLFQTWAILHSNPPFIFRLDTSIIDFLLILH